MLALALCLSLLPTTALAASSTQQDDSVMIVEQGDTMM
jgi:hypothetical protein